MKSAVPVAFIVGAGVLSAAPVASPPNVLDALDAYAKGHFDVIASFVESRPMITFEALDNIAAELERIGPGWIDHQGSLSAPRRRLIAATFALDLARTIWSRRGSPFDTLSGLVPQRLMAWGCARLRDDPRPQDVERLWYFASLSTTDERPWRWPIWDEFLLGAVWPRVQRTLPIAASTAGSAARSASDRRSELPTELAEGHLTHMLARFPDVPEFQFAKARAVLDAARDIG